MSRHAALGTIFAAGLAASLPARAADTSPGVAIGAIASQPAGAVIARSTEVSLEGDATRITMEITVTAGAPARLALRTPLFEWEGDAAMYSDRQFPELIVTADAKPVSPDSASRAIMGRADVTALVAQAGLDPFAITAAPPVVAPGNDRAAFDRLAAQGAVTRLGEVYLAKWSAQRRVSWPAGHPGGHTIVLSYTGRPAFGLTDLATLSRSAGALQAHVKAPFAAFCGAGGQPVMGANAAGQAQPDSNGALRILTLGPPGS